MKEKHKTFGSASIVLMSVFIFPLFLAACNTQAAPSKQNVAICTDDFDYVCGIDFLTVAAQAIDMNMDILLDELLNGKSIADVAEENGIGLQKVVDAIVAAETEWINQQVADGSLSEELASEYFHDLPGDVKEFVEAKNPLEMYGEFDGDWSDGECLTTIDWYAIAAQTLGHDEVSFEKLLDNKSIADVARDNGIDPQKVIDAIIAAETRWINEKLAAGDLSQEEAEEALNFLPEDARDFIEMTFSVEIEVY